MKNKEMICDICKKVVKPLDAHMGKLDGKLITAHIDCWNIKIKETREVECPYCYAIYNIDECGTSFECGSCESSLDVEFDKDGKPYIESQ